MGRWLGRKVGVFSYLPRGFFTIRPQNKPLQVNLQDVLMRPTGCPNAPTRSSIFLQDTTERKRRDLEGDVRIREGEWWVK